MLKRLKALLFIAFFVVGVTGVVTAENIGENFEGGGVSF